MIALPFNAKMTDDLVGMIRGLAAKEQSTMEPDRVTEIQWSDAESTRRSDKSGWVLGSAPRTSVRKEDLFTVDSICLYVRRQDRERLSGRVLDWDRSIGLVAREEKG